MILKVFNSSKDFCIMIQIFPRVVYHTDSDFEETQLRKTRYRREPASLTAQGPQCLIEQNLLPELFNAKTGDLVPSGVTVVPSSGKWRMFSDQSQVLPDRPTVASSLINSQGLTFNPLIPYSQQLPGPKLTFNSCFYMTPNMHPVPGTIKGGQYQAPLPQPQNSNIGCGLS
ncbi:hypothetical protein STEG23_032088 [Scotinomys teguina]